MATLEKLAAELRTAVESRQYREVERLVVAYGELARAYVTSLPPGDPAVRATHQSVQEMLQWTGRMLQASRESIALELSRLPGIQRYLQAPPARGSNWHVEG